MIRNDEDLRLARELVTKISPEAADALETAIGDYEAFGRVRRALRPVGSGAMYAHVPEASDVARVVRHLERLMYPLMVVVVAAAAPDAQPSAESLAIALAERRCLAAGPLASGAVCGLPHGHAGRHEAGSLSWTNLWPEAQQTAEVRAIVARMFAPEADGAADPVKEPFASGQSSTVAACIEVAALALGVEVAAKVIAEQTIVAGLRYLQLRVAGETRFALAIREEPGAERRLVDTMLRSLIVHHAAPALTKRAAPLPDAMTAPEPS